MKKNNQAPVKRSLGEVTPDPREQRLRALTRRARDGRIIGYVAQGLRKGGVGGYPIAHRDYLGLIASHRRAEDDKEPHELPVSERDA